MTAIHGRCDESFGPVADAFRENFSRGEVGAGLTITQFGRTVVQLWGGVADPQTGMDWQEDTIGPVFSATKGLAALAMLMLTDRGLLDPDAPVSQYWPEFGQAGKEAITVRTLLNHRAGLLAVPRDLSLAELADEALCERVMAELAPRWTPGEDQGYHGVSIGLYTRALFRRVAGESMGSFLAREVAAPLKADIWLGLPEALDVRACRLLPAGPKEVVTEVLPAVFSRSLEGRVFRAVALGGDARDAFRYPSVVGAGKLDACNTRAVRELELPWMGAFASAPGLARVYAALANDGEVDGVRLVREKTLRPVYARQGWSERDRVLQKPIGWSQGFVKDEPHLFSPNLESFGHPGAGGFLGWADPVAQVSVGYVLNKMSTSVRSPRAVALCRALYKCLGQPMPAAA